MTPLEQWKELARIENARMRQAMGYREPYAKPAAQKRLSAKSEARVVAYVMRWGPVGRRKVAAALGVGVSSVSAVLGKLAVEGRIERIGGGRETAYRGIKGNQKWR